MDSKQFRTIINRFTSEMEIAFDYSDDFILTLCRDTDSIASCRWQKSLYNSDLAELFPESPYWFAQIVKGSIPYELIDHNKRNKWISLVIREILAIDTICQIFGHDDELKLLGLTIINSSSTTKTAEVLEVARGLKVTLDFNENKNIPQLRDKLKISKHLLLIFNENQQQWPDFISVVDAIYESVDLDEIYQVIDFSRAEECFDWLAFFESPAYLWGVYSLAVQENTGIKRFNTTSSILEIIQAAFLDELDESNIANIVQESIWYKELQNRQPSDADHILASLILQATMIYRQDEP